VSAAAIAIIAILSVTCGVLLWACVRDAKIHTDNIEQERVVANAHAEIAAEHAQRAREAYRKLSAIRDLLDAKTWTLQTQAGTPLCRRTSNNE